MLPRILTLAVGRPARVVGSVALACLFASVALYLLPTLSAAGIEWQTRPYGLRGATGELRLPGYLWPSSLIALFSFVLVPAVFPRRLLSHRLGALGLLSAALAILLSLLLVAWLVVTPMFS
jgi:hypothetical protein